MKLTKLSLIALAAGLVTYALAQIHEHGITKSRGMPIADAPVEVVVEQVTEKMRPVSGRMIPMHELKLRFTNISQRRVIACSIRIDFPDNPVSRQGHMIATGFGDPRIRSSYGPGEVWYSSLELSTNDPDTKYDVKLDYIRFKDDGLLPMSWGPDTLGQGCRLNGAINAHRAERARLRRLLNTGGLQVVADDLTAAPAP